MHYKRDLDSIKLEFSQVTNMLLNSDNPKEVRSATGVDCIDEMVQKLTNRFVVRKEVDLTDSETNTSFDDKENIESLNLQEKADDDVSEEEIITPRMMQDITNTMDTTPKKAPRSPSKIPTKSGKPMAMPE